MEPAPAASRSVVVLARRSEAWRPVAVLTRGLALGCLGLGLNPSDRVRTLDERSSAPGTSRL